MTRRRLKTPSGRDHNPALVPNTDRLGVGDAAPRPPEPEPVPAPAPARPERTRVPFGSYLDPQLQREFKAVCVLRGMEMQDGLEQAIRAWLRDQQAS